MKKGDGQVHLRNNDINIAMNRKKRSNLKLPIETGRWANILKQNRKCYLCNLEIGNEFHYLFICSYPQYYLRNPSLYKNILV
jgi:hypothetical protein